MKEKTKTCRCRPAKRHRDCAFCGCGGDGVRICGACRAEGIDGPVIKGTSGTRCAKHRRAK